MQTEPAAQPPASACTDGPQQTEGWGEALGRRLQAGQVVALTGPLGAGKTTLIRGLCRGLGVDESQVSSPTFVLMQIYEGRLPVYHFDAYRLEGPADLEGIGALEYFEGSDGVCLVEWPDRAAGLLPPDRLEVELSVIGPDCREIRWQALGEQSRAAVEGL